MITNAPRRRVISVIARVSHREMGVKLTIVCFLAQITGICGFHSSDGQTTPHEPHWGYVDNGHGPESWPSLFPIQCAGHYQSPIDIRTAKTVYDPKLQRFQFSRFSRYSDARFELLNNGHTIKVKTSGQFYFRGGGFLYNYKIEQFHFHWGSDYEQGSEHTLDGRAFPMELHIVAWNTDLYHSEKEAEKHHDGLAVLGVLYELSPYDNPELEPMVQVLPFVRDPDLNRSVILGPMDIQLLLPTQPQRYYRYHGSLTTPRCYESVTWTLFANTNTISQRQLNVFRQTLTSIHSAENTSFRDGREPLINNYRPVQPLNYRTVCRSFFPELPPGWS